MVRQLPAHPQGSEWWGLEGKGLGVGRCKGQRGPPKTKAKRNKNCDEMGDLERSRETISQEKGSQSEAETEREANIDRWQS